VGRKRLDPKRLDPKRLVFIDRDPGEDQHGAHPWTLTARPTARRRRSSPRFVIIGIAAPFGLDGPVNGKCFLAYVKEALARRSSQKLVRRTGSVLRLRNAASGEAGRPMAQLQRGIDRLWTDYEAERASMDIAGPMLKELHAQKTSIDEELAAAPIERKSLASTPLRFANMTNTSAAPRCVPPGCHTRL
jgi:hypothetical protein